MFSICELYFHKFIFCYIQNYKNYAMFSICELYFHKFIFCYILNENLADDQRRGISVCIK